MARHKMAHQEMVYHEKKQKRRGGWFWRLALPAALIGGVLYVRRQRGALPWQRQMGEETGVEEHPGSMRGMIDQEQQGAGGEMSFASYNTGGMETREEGKAPAEVQSWGDKSWREDLPGREKMGDMQAQGNNEVESLEDELADLEDEDIAQTEVALPVTGTENMTPTMDAPTMEMEEGEEMEERQPSGEPDDLKLIEGIGPSISGLLRSQGITTFRQLADASIDRLDKILEEANLRRIADPTTWPEQARFAVDEDWDGLERFQRTLRAGRRAQSG